MQDIEGSRSAELVEYATAAGCAANYSRSWTGPVDVFGLQEGYWLQMTFPQPQAASGCFPERWGSHRFEPIGDVFMMPAGEFIHARSEARHQESIACVLPPATVHKWFGGEWEITDRQLKTCLNIVNPAIRTLLTRLGKEIREPGFASEVLVEAMFVEIAIELRRHLDSISDGEGMGGLSPWRLRAVDERLAEVADSPSLSELAELCNLSVRHLTRGFRASRGFSIGSYVAATRIEHAKRLLKSGKSVKGVAYEMGFTSPSNFSAAFRRATGQSPRQFREGEGHAAIADHRLLA